MQQEKDWSYSLIYKILLSLFHKWLLIYFNFTFNSITDSESTTHSRYNTFPINYITVYLFSAYIYLISPFVYNNENFAGYEVKWISLQ